MSLREQLEAKIIFTVESDAPFIYHPHNSPNLVREVQSFTADSYADAASEHGESEPATPLPPTDGIVGMWATFLQFRCDSPMKNEAAGFVFGNDATSCDIFLQGVSQLSKQLFTITINPDSGALMLQILCPDKKKNGIHLESDSLGRKLLTSQRALVPERIHVKLPDFDMYIKIVDHGDRAALHKLYWTQFCMRYAQSVPLPSLSALNLYTRPSSTKRRRGPYLLAQRLGRGGFGTVYRVIHQQTGNSFAAKRFHDHRCQPLNEATILQGLSHV